MNFFHHSLRKLAKATAPLMWLTRSDVSWEWTDVESKVFERIKELVTTAPCSALVDLADGKLVLQVNTDASKVVVGSVLLHVDG